MQRAIIAVAGRTASESDDPIYGIDEAEREDVSTALRLSPASAQQKIDIARALTNFLPNTCSALATGEISTAHATAIAREAASALNKGLPESVIFQLEERAISYSEFHTPSQVGSLVRKVIATSTPQEFEETVADAREMRRVSCFNDFDGMSTIVALLPAHEAQVVMSAIEAFIIREGSECSDCRATSKANPLNDLNLICTHVTGAGAGKHFQGVARSDDQPGRSGQISVHVHALRVAVLLHLHGAVGLSDRGALGLRADVGRQ
jgi:hypothetical protein